MAYSVPMFDAHSIAAGVAVQIGGMFAAVAAHHQQRGAGPLQRIHGAVVFLEDWVRQNCYALHLCDF